jgi:hypothetical protein
MKKVTRINLQKMSLKEEKDWANQINNVSKNRLINEF